MQTRFPGERTDDNSSAGYPPFNVQAPMKLIMFLCFPIPFMTSISDTRSASSCSVASAAEKQSLRSVPLLQSQPPSSTIPRRARVIPKHFPMGAKHGVRAQKCSKIRRVRESKGRHILECGNDKKLTVIS